MKRVAVLTASTLAFLAVCSTSVAAPPFYWWTPSQADQAVLKAKPPFVDGQRLPIVRAGCTGQGKALKTGPDRNWPGTVSSRSPHTFYRVFRCHVLYQLPNGNRAYSQTSSLWIRTSTKRPRTIACRVWSGDGAEVATRCP